MRRAVLFGQNAVDQAAYSGWSGELSGCVPDARDLAVMAAASGFESEAKLSGWDIRGVQQWPWRLTLDCTLKAFRDVHKEMQRAAKPGDVFLIGDSGHGGRSGTIETLCFADGQMEDIELHDIMCGWPAFARVIYVLDTCHSGGMDRDLEKFRPRYCPLWVSQEHKPSGKSRSGDVSAAILQLCACRAEETASDGPHNGAWTGALLAAWDYAKRAREALTWGRWFELASGAMQMPFPDQHPVLKMIGRNTQALLSEPMSAF